MFTKKNHEPKDKEPKPIDGQEPSAAPEAVEETVVLNKGEYEQLKAEAAKSAEYWDKMLRQQADFENIRKRLERDRQEFQKYAHEDLVVDLLGILDDLERSVEAAETNKENHEVFLKGIEMILAHLYDLLKKKGVKPITARGEKFDPNAHEALMQTETADHEDGEVLEELQKGYRLCDRVIRTAKVRVAKKIEKKN